MSDLILEKLTDLGFSTQEANVYLALVTQSPSGAARIAKQLALSRSTVYTIIDRLMAKGLLVTSYQNNVKQFAAAPTSALDALLRREALDAKKRLESFSTLSPLLAAITNQSGETPKITHIEGKDSLRKIYLDMLRAAPKGALLRVIRDDFKWNDDWEFVRTEEWEKRTGTLRKEKNIDAHVLLNESPQEKKHVTHYKNRAGSTFRFLPKAHQVKHFVMYILGETVSIVSMDSRDFVGIRITNKWIAENFTQLFDALWLKGKKL